MTTMAMTHMKQFYTTRRLIMLNLISGGSALIGIIISSSLMKFYTDLIGLSPAMYGVIFLVFSIWNGMNDILIAYWTDRHPFHSKLGKYGRYIRWATPVVAVTIISLLFVSPDWSEIVIATYMLIMMLVYEGAKTLWNRHRYIHISDSHFHHLLLKQKDAGCLPLHLITNGALRNDDYDLSFDTNILALIPHISCRPSFSQIRSFLRKM